MTKSNKNKKTIKFKSLFSIYLIFLFSLFFGLAGTWGCDASGDIFLKSSSSNSSLEIKNSQFSSSPDFNAYLVISPTGQLKPAKGKQFYNRDTLLKPSVTQVLSSPSVNQDINSRANRIQNP